MSFSRKALRRASITLAPDVYAGRILAAKLETLDEVAQTFGVSKDEPEFLTLREGYIARAREQAVEAVTPPITPRAMRQDKLRRMRAEKKERELRERIEKEKALGNVVETPTDFYMSPETLDRLVDP